jgi:hypothetical protein
MRAPNVLVVASILLALSAIAGTNETTVTGIVVDSRGRPMPQALVSYVSRRTDRVIVGTDLQTGPDGRFEFTAPQPISDLSIRADSPDLKHSGRLEHISKKGNVIVVR